MYSETQERKYVFGLFENGLKPYKEKRIALYGLGVNTFYILNHSTDYNIVALMDASKEGSTIEGLPVLSAKEAVGKVDVIVIVARSTIVPIIYQRIKQLEDNDICILDIRGDFVSDHRELEDIERNPYWNRTYEELIEKIDQYDVISFDVFDTLLMRKIMRPSDLFSVIGKQVKEKYQIEYEKIRHDAARTADRKYGIATYDEIYQEFENISSLDYDTVNCIKEIEVNTEKKFLIPREVVIKAFYYALSSGKRVFLVTDMYFTKEYMEPILNSNGIRGYEGILISAEEGVAKWPDGGLFQVLREKYELEGVSILHIGDSPGGDVEAARAAGIDGIQILSAYEMLAQSSLSKILVYASTVEDYIIVGQIMGYFFSDPFALSRYKGRLYIDTLEKLGYLGYGALFTGFIVWAIKLCNEKEIDKILFLARDGYPIEKAYQCFLKNREEIKAPDSIYVLASRSCLAAAALYDENDLEEAIKRVIPDVAGSGRCILINRFGVEPDADDDEADTVKEIEELHQYIRRYKKKILRNSEKIRKEYLEYLADLNIINADKLAVFDTQTLGTAAYYFEKIIGKEVTLLAYILINAVNYSLYDDERSYAYIGKDTTGMATYQYTRACTLNECIYTSDKGQFLFMKNKKPVFSEKEKPQLNFDKIYKVQEEINRFVSEFTELAKYGTRMQQVSSELGDALIGCLKTNKCVVKAELKQYFSMQDKYAANAKESFGFS